jgi:pseudaminic acid biosynthesis-associated methylase
MSPREDRPPRNVGSSVAAWEGEFGRAYTDRNAVDPRVIAPAFAAMLDGLEVQSVLEVGCNRGHNLAALETILGADAELYGIDPNPYALGLAAQAVPRAKLSRATAYDLPFAGDRFDLAFTAGVLIHVPLADLPQALSEIHRTSRRYILGLEYHADTETPVPYRGRDDLLWKRDFLRHYQEAFPDLVLRRQGFWAEGDGFGGWFDDLTWWVLEKPAPPR